MSFDAAVFLAGLFADGSIPEAANSEPSGGLSAPPEIPGDALADGNERNWANLDEQDRDYLTAPRRYPEPCAWCGGRTRHNPMCFALHCWPTLDFGRFRGKAISDVRVDYLQWVLAARAGSGDLRNSIRAYLRWVREQSTGSRRRGIVNGHVD